MTAIANDALPATADLRSLPHRAQALLRRPASVAIRRRWDLHLHDEERVPGSGPVLLACNHIGWLDGPLMVGIAPRTVHALVKHEMFVGRTGALLRAVGQIPVNRGDIDVRAIRRAVRALRDDQAVVVYPEGTRGEGELLRLKRGLAYLALVTGAPVVPVAILGTRISGESVSGLPPRGRRIDVVYGKPVLVDAIDWPRRRESVEELTRSLQNVLIANLQRAIAITGQGLPGRAPDQQARDADMVGPSAEIEEP